MQEIKTNIKRETKGMKIIKAIMARFREWGWFFEGRISFSQACYLMIPSFVRPKKDTKVKFLGKPFIITLGEIGDFFLLTNQIVSSNQYHIELIKKNAIVFDAGANMGIFSIFAAANHPDSTIYAFEPTPTTFSVLKENAKYYPISGCSITHSEKRKEVRLSSSHPNRWEITSERAEFPLR